MKRLPTKALTPSSAKFDEGLSGYSSEVSFWGKLHHRTALIVYSPTADKSMSILLGRPICLRDEDCTVHFPKELDDE